MHGAINVNFTLHGSLFFSEDFIHQLNVHWNRYLYYVLVTPLNMARDDTVKKPTNVYKRFRVSYILTL